MSLIAHYPLNGDTKDYSGNGNDLIPHGYIPSDDFIGAHKTTTNSDYLIASKEWVYDQEVTLAIWAKETGDDGSSIAGLISDHYHTPSPMSGITLYNRSNGQLTFAVGLGTSRPSYSYPHLFDSSEWCHYAVTYNNGLVKVYQNGVMLGSRNVPPIVHVDGRVGCLGRWAPSYSTYNLVGSLSDARVYDHALSDKEIKELSKAKVLHYKFDEQDLATKIVKDCSGFGNDGALADATAPTWSEDSPVGKGSLEFSGGKFIETNHKIPLNDDLTVSFWVNTNPTNTSTLGCSRTSLGKGFSIFILNKAIRWDTGDQQWSTGHVVKPNQWVHYTLLKRGSVKELYENAVLVKSTTYEGSMTSLGSLYSIGMSQVGGSRYGNPLNGTVSDYRIYATALTPEDILEIYQTRASIDNLGNLHVYEFDEVSEGTVGITSQGIAKFTSINEVGRPVRYIRDWLNGSTANTANHWVEIQAIDPSGTNVALGKSSPSERITDGNTASSPYYSAGSGLKSVTVDLGVAHNITYLHIWHYWTGGRTYHNTKTEVSTDGTNWVTVFDSAVEGEYAESSEGKKILLYPDKVSIDSDGNIYTKEILEN